MADLLDGLARHLDGLGLVDYPPTGTAGDLFVEIMPPAPDAAVSLALYAGAAPESLDDAEQRRLQMRVRGGPDPRVSRNRAEALYRALHGLAGVQLPTGHGSRSPPPAAPPPRWAPTAPAVRSTS